MAYIFVNSFKRGLDARRSRISAQQGSLIVGNNVHISRGGEVEKRRAFVLKHSLPEGVTFGLHATRFGIYVFGSAAGVTVPSGVRYQRLQAPSGANMSGIESVDSFDGVPYVVARFADGSVHHFYNGTRVTDWDKLAPDISDLDSLGAKLADLVTTDPAVSAAFSAPGGVPTITITALTPNVSVPIHADVQNGGTLNNSAVVNITTPADTNVAQVATVELSGGYTPANDANDAWTVTVEDRRYTLSGAAAGVGSTARTFRGKVYATVQGLLYFSDVQNPMRWVTAYAPDPSKPDAKVDTFAGFENVSAQTSSADELVTVAPYQNHLAVFARRSTQIWLVVPGDPKDNVPVQILDNVGTLAPRSAISFGEMDVFFLSDSGIRSLRARDASNAAVVFDVGTSIDPMVRSLMDGMSEADKRKAVGVIEPRDGRYMLAIGSKVFVYSFYPASDISAWTTYEPGFPISDFAAVADKLYCRSGDDIYLLGGDSGMLFDDCLAHVEMSWLDAEKPAHKKSFKGLDFAAEGNWKVEYNTNLASNTFAIAGHISGPTFSLPEFRFACKGTHIGLRLTTNDAAASRLSSAAIHFTYDGEAR